MFQMLFFFKFKSDKATMAQKQKLFFKFQVFHTVQAIVLLLFVNLDVIHIVVLSRLVHNTHQLWFSSHAVCTATLIHCNDVL